MDADKDRAFLRQTVLSWFLKDRDPEVVDLGIEAAEKCVAYIEYGTKEKTNEE